MSFPIVSHAIAAAPWLGFPVIGVIAWAAGRHRFAHASREAVLTWCREIGRQDDPPSQPKRKR